MIKKLLYSLVLTGVILGIGGCGNSSSSEETNKKIVLGTAKLGNLADANVTIYKMEKDGSFTPLWHEKTSSGEILSKIGKFNLHIDELKDDSIYLYKITGGKDWDVDDNGVIDENYTVNKGTIRVIAKGSDIKKVKNKFVVSFATELLYEKVSSYLRNDFNKTEFFSIVKKEIQKIIGDINKDGKIDIADILTFDPSMKKEKLENFYKIKLQSILDMIHQGKLPLFNLSATLNSILTKGHANYVVLSSDGKKAYIADGKNGLVIIDVSNLTNLKQISSIDTAGDAFSVTLSKDEKTAYIADAYNGLVIVDINNSKEPKIISSIDTDSWANYIVLSKDEKIAYVAEDNGIDIIDISNLAKPKKISSINKGSAYSLVLSNDGTKVYVADYDDGLVIIDVNDSKNPKIISSIDTEGYANDIKLSKDGNLAYIANGNNGLVIVNINDSKNPKIINSIDTSFYAKRITLSGDGTKAYVSDEKGGLIIIDISNPLKLKKIKSFIPTRSVYGVALSKNERLAYIADIDGLVIVDLNFLLNN